MTTREALEILLRYTSERGELHELSLARKVVRDIMAQEGMSFVSGEEEDRLPEVIDIMIYG